MYGIFGDLFDFNRDGELSVIEKGLELCFLDELLREEAGSSWDDDSEED